MFDAGGMGAKKALMVKGVSGARQAARAAQTRASFFSTIRASTVAPSGSASSLKS